MSYDWFIHARASAVCPIMRNIVALRARALWLWVLLIKQRFISSRASSRRCSPVLMHAASKYAASAHALFHVAFQNSSYASCILYWYFRQRARL